MPYVMTRDISELKLKHGQALKHEQGKLPAALKFSAVWKDSLEEEAEEPDNSKLLAELEVASEKLASSEVKVLKLEGDLAELEAAKVELEAKVAELSKPAPETEKPAEKSKTK